MEKKISDWLNNELNGTPYFLVDIAVSGSGTSIHVSIDGDDGVDIDKCIEINRFLNNKLETEGISAGLQVSSPGVDRPLRLIRQYRKNVGRKLQVEIKNDDQVEGKLAYADFEKIILSKKRKKGIDQVDILLEDIRKATVSI